MGTEPEPIGRWRFDLLGVTDAEADTYVDAQAAMDVDSDAVTRAPGDAFLQEGRLAGYSETGISRLPLPLAELQMHGTTTLAFKYGDGVVVAVDSRASVGSYVGSRTVKKAFPVGDHMVATMAGGAADCTHWIRRVARRTKMLEEDLGSTLPVMAVARLFARSLREFKGSDLSIGTMVAGVDVRGVGGIGSGSDSGSDCESDCGNGSGGMGVCCPALFYVDNSCNCVPGDLFCVGSGAPLAYGILDTAAPDGLHALPTLAAAVDVAVRAIRQATYRDAFSGGYINVLHINATGIHQLLRTDSRTLALPSVVGAPSKPSSLSAA
jgi:20S proteasome subunit beta 5